MCTWSAVMLCTTVPSAASPLVQRIVVKQTNRPPLLLRCSPANFISCPISTRLSSCCCLSEIWNAYSYSCSSKVLSRSPQYSSSLCFVDLPWTVSHTVQHHHYLNFWWYCSVYFGSISFQKMWWNAHRMNTDNRLRPPAYIWHRAQISRGCVFTHNSSLTENVSVFTWSEMA